MIFSLDPALFFWILCCHLSIFIHRRRQKNPNPHGSGFGGDKGSRTPDLLNAIQALSQLSYTPKGRVYYSILVPVCQYLFANFLPLSADFFQIYGIRFFCRIYFCRQIDPWAASLWCGALFLLAQPILPRCCRRSFTRLDTTSKSLVRIVSMPISKYRWASSGSSAQNTVQISPFSWALSTMALSK